jgi:hypothetical protein
VEIEEGIMYLTTFGGSGLLHLLAVHPRVAAVFGIAATVSMLASPLGSGRFAGTADRLEKIERSVNDTGLAAVARQARAEREAKVLLEEGDKEAIDAAVASVLRRCGRGCTDLSTATIARDPELLRGVLILHGLDQAVAEARQAGGASIQASKSQ